MLPLTGRSKEMVRLALRAEYPAFKPAFEEKLDAAIKANVGASDISDVIVDAVRDGSRFSIKAMWPDEAERSHVEAWAATIQGTEDEREREIWRKFLDEVQEYRGRLLDMHEDEIGPLAEKAFLAEQEKTNPLRPEYDIWAFYSKPDAKADFQRWSRLPTWSVDEAVALSFGKDPEKVSLDKLKSPFATRSPFIMGYRARHDHISRAVRVGDLSEPMRKEPFIEWADSNGLELPPELDLPNVVSDARMWERRYQEVVEERDKLLVDLRTAQAELAGWRGEDFSKIAPKARKSLFRIVLGMAIARYGHATVGRPGARERIEADLNALGLGLGDDAIGGWLKEAASELEYAQTFQYRNYASNRPIAPKDD
ncbi:hypothetical protein NKI72_31230 [Mesorhizobium sp. M0437]|uniref:hypothetical protein n=1 Tax=Mesorhizobium sp. M0437 TaxID=2956945 RepID=UPI00333B219D